MVLSSTGLRDLGFQGRECFYQGHNNGFIKQEAETAIWPHCQVKKKVTVLDVTIDLDSEGKEEYLGSRRFSW